MLVLILLLNLLAFQQIYVVILAMGLKFHFGRTNGLEPLKDVLPFLFNLLTKSDWFVADMGCRINSK
jgi:hypothetical protein